MSKNFSSEYLFLNSALEVPQSFIAWCSLSAISVALGRRIWLEMGPFRIYPNMYIILVAGAGKMRKSTAIKVARDLIYKMSPVPNVIGQKLTPEALIDAMTHLPPAAAKKIVLGNDPIGQGMIITDELTTLLNRTTSDNGMATLLTDFWDCPDLWKSQTISRGIKQMRDIQLGMLAATTPEELRKAIPEEAIGSGLASRILFIYETESSKPIAFPTYTPRHLEARDFCINFLQRVQMLSGPVEVSAEAKTWFTEFYNTECYNSPLLDDAHLRGYASRRHIHLLKLAMNLSVALYERPELSVAVLEKAKMLVNYNEVQLQKIVRLLTMSEKGAIIQYIYSIIHRHGRVTREQLLAEVSHRIDNRELTEYLETLKQSRQVETFANFSTIYYQIRGYTPSKK